MDITERGEVYGIGQGDDFYGIWDLRAEGAPVNRYPKTPEGWQGAWERWRELEGEFGRPPWRRATFGMVLLHIVIGLALGFLGMILAMGIFVGSGREPDVASESTEVTMGLAVLGAWILALTGWLLFVYLKAKPPARWITLLALWLGGIGLMIGLGLALLPTT